MKRPTNNDFDPRTSSAQQGGEQAAVPEMVLLMREVVRCLRKIADEHGASVAAPAAESQQFSRQKGKQAKASAKSAALNRLVSECPTIKAFLPSSLFTAGKHA